MADSGTKDTLTPKGNFFHSITTSLLIVCCKYNAYKDPGLLSMAMYSEMLKEVVLEMRNNDKKVL